MDASLYAVTPLNLLGGLLLVAGAAFLLLGGLGLVRMPDVFNRIQAGTKATTLGTLLSLAGMGCLRPRLGPQAAAHRPLHPLYQPLLAQILARAAHRVGLKKSPLTRVDRLAEDTGEAR